MDTTNILAYNPMFIDDNQTIREDELANSTEYNEMPSQFNFDWLFRVNQSESDPLTYNITCKETSTVVSYLEKLFQGIVRENTILKTFVKNLWKNYQYQQEYISFLLGNYSKEDFMKIAEDYAEPFQETSDKEYVLLAGDLATTLLQQSIDSYDLSLLLSLECSSVEHHLRLTGNTSEILDT